MLLHNTDSFHTFSYLAVHWCIVAVLVRAETPGLACPSSDCVHPACFISCAAQFLLLQLQTCQVKGQRPLHRAQVVQQPQRDVLSSTDKAPHLIQSFGYIFISIYFWWCCFVSPGAAGAWGGAGGAETGKHLCSCWDLSCPALSDHPGPGAADSAPESSCGLQTEQRHRKLQIYIYVWYDREQTWLPSESYVLRWVGMIHDWKNGEWEYPLSYSPFTCWAGGSALGAALPSSAWQSTSSLTRHTSSPLLRLLAQEEQICLKSCISPRRKQDDTCLSERGSAVSTRPDLWEVQSSCLCVLWGRGRLKVTDMSGAFF